MKVPPTGAGGMPLDRDHLVLLLGGALVGAGLVAVLPGLGTTDPGSSPSEPRSEAVRFHGVAHVGGPAASAGLPLLPLEADGDGLLSGVAEVTVDGRTRSVDDWHRPCNPKGTEALPDPGNRSAPLRYEAFAGPTMADPFGGEDPWYAERDGEPVDVDDLPPGRPAYATWGPGDPGDVPVYVLLGLNASDRTADHDPFDVEGVLAFSAEGHPHCRVTALVPDAAPEGAREAVEDHPRYEWPLTPEVAVDAETGDLWDPTAVVEDVAAVPTHPRPPPGS